MFTEFASIQFSRQELEQLHSALLAQAMVEDALCLEQGKPMNEQRPMLARIEGLLMQSEEELHAKDHVIDDQLWEYSWFMFTDEWAIFRAHQDALKENPEMTGAQLEERVESLYRQHFDTYIGEIDMQELQNRRLPNKRKQSKSNP